MNNNEQQLAAAWCNTDQGRDFLRAQRDTAKRWGTLSAPIDPLENTRTASAMSALTKNGKVPTYDEAQEYARQQSAPDPDYFTQHSYDQLSDGF